MKEVNLMKKLVVPFILSAVILTGCETAEEQHKREIKETKVVGQLENVQVIKKIYKERSKYSPAEYYVVLAKGEEQIQLQLFGEDAYNVLHEGVTVNVGYTDEFYIKEIKFPELEKEE